MKRIIVLASLALFSLVASLVLINIGTTSKAVACPILTIFPDDWRQCAFYPREC